jgi:hypothetical protein
LKWSIGALIVSSAMGQTIYQTSQGSCSPPVNTNGNVTITCNGVSSVDVKKLEKGVDILNAIMRQDDAKIMSKLDAVLALLTPLKDEVSVQRKELDAIREYTEVSKLNFIGTTGRVLPPLKEETPISRMLEGAYTMDNDQVLQLCDSAAIAKYEAVAAAYPKFPFSYYALARCHLSRGDIAGRSYATKAIEILKKTIMIDGHHAGHDQALGELEQLLRQ